MHFRFLLAQDFGLKAGDIRGIFVAGLRLTTKIPLKNAALAAK
jgi:hypothetical protein